MRGAIETHADYVTKLSKAVSFREAQSILALASAMLRHAHQALTDQGVRSRTSMRGTLALAFGIKCKRIKYEDYVAISREAAK